MEKVFSATAAGATVDVELPEFKCHKIVRAAKIVGIGLLPTDPEHSAGKKTYRLALAGGCYVDVTQVWLTSKTPQVGGVYVQYDDGFSSYSPLEAFMNGYTPYTEGAAMPTATEFENPELDDKIRAANAKAADEWLTARSLAIDEKEAMTKPSSDDGPEVVAE